MVDKGVLKSFLTSRAPISGFLHSNGHGRSAPGRDPVARMSNLIVESSKALDAASLKGALIAKARRQDKPFGLIIRDVTGGNTDTSGYAYQVLQGASRGSSTRTTQRPETSRWSAAWRSSVRH